jgi:hypothetical protein
VSANLAEQLIADRVAAEAAVAQFLQTARAAQTVIDSLYEAGQPLPEGTAAVERAYLASASTASSIVRQVGEVFEPIRNAGEDTLADLVAAGPDGAPGVSGQ